MVVNGKLWPYLEVEPRKYRFRILNASNLRGYELKLSNNEVFHQIGTDLGLMDEPVQIDSFIIEPAERIDLIIDFTHPIHLHLVHFRVLGRKVFTEEDFDENGNYIFDIENLKPPHPYENGKKDTVAAEPGQVTSIVMHFKEHAGDYVWHCHLLEHEDNDMMRPLVVVKD